MISYPLSKYPSGFNEAAGIPRGRQPELRKRKATRMMLQ